MIKFTESDYAEVYKESCHFREMTDEALINEFKSIKDILQSQELYNQDTIALHLVGTLNRFLTYSNKCFEKSSFTIEDNIPDFIIRMSKMCDESFTVQDLKNFLYQFLKRLNESKGCENGITYEKLKNITCKKFGLKKIDFTKGVRFTRRSKEEIIPEPVSLPYDVSLDLFLTALLKPVEVNLNLNELTEKELARIQQDFEECLENMKRVAKGEIKI